MITELWVLMSLAREIKLYVYGKQQQLQFVLRLNVFHEHENIFLYIKN